MNNQITKLDIDLESAFNQFLSVKGINTKSFCPCKAKHSKPNADTDFRHYLSNNPKADGMRLISGNCYHTSCRDSQREYFRTLNREWRLFIISSGKQLPKVDEQYREKLKQELQDKRIEKLRIQIQTIEFQSHVVHAPIPEPVFDSPADDFNAFLQLWKPDDIIFIGAAKESQGFLVQADQCDPFNNRDDFPEFTNVSTYQDINIGRVNQNIKERKYIVMESDTLDKQQQWNLLTYINTIHPMIMAVDTGGKSIHGWFKFDNWFTENKFLLKELGYDEAMFRPAQICRLPGMYRMEKEKFQRIIYFNQPPPNCRTSTQTEGIKTQSDISSYIV